MNGDGENLGDGTTTGRKLEGFQIRPRVKGSRFTASEAPSLDLLSITLGHFKWSSPFPGDDANSIADRVARTYDPRPSHFHATNGVTIDHVTIM